jgi:hypothetical protein
MKYAAVLGCLLNFSGCLTGPVVIEDVTRASAEKPLQAGQTVLVLPPVVTYEMLHDGSHLEAPPDSAADIDRPMVAAVEDQLTRRGLKLYRDSDPKGTAPVEATIPVAVQLLDLMTGKAGAERPRILDRLKSLKASSGARLASVAAAKVKVADGGGYEPFFSVVWYGTSRTDFTFCLISLDTGEAVWMREVLLRSLPSTGSVSSSVGCAFAELNAGKGE